MRPTLKVLGDKRKDWKVGRGGPGVVGYVMLVKVSLGSVRVLKDRPVKVCKRTLFAGFKFFFWTSKNTLSKVEFDHFVKSWIWSLCRKHDRKCHSLPVALEKNHLVESVFCQFIQPNLS